MSIHVLKNSFNGGEISQLLDARYDSEKYGFSCRKLQNFIPKVSGGAFRRPGTVYLGDVGNDASAVRLMPLNISATVRYVIELGDGYARIWDSDGAPFLYLNAVLELTTPYAAADLFSVQIAQIGNVCYFTHPDYPVQRMVRYFNASFNEFHFIWAALAYDFPAFRDYNLSAITATPSHVSGTARTITFSATPYNDGVPRAQYVGAKILLSQRRAASHVELDLTATADTAALSVLGNFQMFTYGTATGTLTLQEQNEAGAWVNVRSFEMKSDRQLVYSSLTEKTTNLRLSFAHTSGTGATAYLEAGDSRRVGYATITATSGTVATVDIDEAFDSTAATTEWAFEAFAAYAGYPRAIAFHEQRLWFGGTGLQPGTFWASRTNDFENFERGAFDADSLAFTLAASEGSAIQSLLSHEALLIFTQSEEWTATTSEQTVITPSNVFVRRQSRFGSEYLPALLANNRILFIQRGARKLREFQYSINGSQGESFDLTLFSEHLTRGGIRQVAFQQQPDPVLWVVTNSGGLLAMTYDSDQGVIAWSRHVTAGSFESVSVIYGGANASDEVWLTVLRGEDRFIERMLPEAFTLLEENSVDGMVYLDCTTVKTFSAPGTVITGLGRFEGQTVSIVADGGLETDQAVTGGLVTLEQPASTVVIGLPFTSILQPSKLEIPLDDGTSQGRKFLCKRIAVNFWQSSGMQYADDDEAPEHKWFPIAYRPLLTPLGEPAALFTGVASVNNLGAHGENVNVTIRQTAPLPCNVLAVIPKFDVYGK